MINYDSITKFFDLNTLDLQYHKVTQDVFSIEDVSSSLEIIFQYHRKKGFPHYNIPKHKKNTRGSPWLALLCLRFYLTS